MGRDFLSVNGHIGIDVHGRVLGEGNTGRNVVPDDECIVRQQRPYRTVMNTDHAAKSGITAAFRRFQNRT